MSAETDITLASIGGEYMESAVLVAWHAAEGDRVAEGDPVAVVETVKAATEIAAPASGLLSILVAQGEEVSVGTVLGRVAAPAFEERAVAAIENPAVAEAATARTSAMPRRWQQAYASPLAKRLAAERGIDLSCITGSGPNRRIVRADLPMTEVASAAQPTATTDGAVYSLALDVAAGPIQELRAARWERGGRPGLGALVAEAVRQVLPGQDETLRTLSVHEGEECGTVPGLAVLDLAPFGLAAFMPPPLPGARATLGVADIRSEVSLTARPQGGVAIEGASRLRLTLTADHNRLPFSLAVRLLAAVRDALEAEPCN